MESIFRSASDFALGFLRRFYFWGVAIFLDPVDAWGRISKLFTNTPSDPFAAIPASWQISVATALVLWSAFMTYHELHKKLDQRENFPDLPARDAFRRVAEKSVFAKQHSNDAEWPFTLNDEIRGNLRLGRLKSWGRRGYQMQLKGYKSPLQPIPEDHWNNYKLQSFDALRDIPLPHGMSSQADGGGSGYHDVHFKRSELDEIWRPLRFWEKWRAQPLILPS